MKRKLILIGVVFLLISGCSARKSYIKSAAVSGRPKVFCQVIQPPNPVLMGYWQLRTPKYSNPLEYRLVKRNGKYALYYYYSEYRGRDVYAGWRSFTINGDVISNQLEDNRIKITTAGGKVYYYYDNILTGEMIKVE